MADSYAIVQHSGYGYRRDPQFMYGLEFRELRTKRDIERVKKAGGIVVEGCAQADAVADELMYPPEYGGMIPVANQYGAFSDVEVDRLRVFVPNPGFNLAVTLKELGYG